MSHGGPIDLFRSLAAAALLVALGVFPGSDCGFIRAADSDKPADGNRSSRRGKVVSTAVEIERSGPTAKDDPPQRVAAAGTALNAELDQLKRERDSLATVRSSPIRVPDSQSDSIVGERDKLKRQLNGLVTELARRPRPEPKQEASDAKGAAKSLSQQRSDQSKRNKVLKPSGEGAKPRDGAPASVAAGPVDPMALAQSLFRTGDYEGSLKALELAKKTATDPRDRIAIKYFSAACLGKLGNVQESTTLFREVANSKADDVLAECARWQLSAQQWRETTVARIAQLRAVQLAAKTEVAEADSGRRSSIR